MPARCTRRTNYSDFPYEQHNHQQIGIAEIAWFRHISPPSMHQTGQTASTDVTTNRLNPRTAFSHRQNRLTRLDATPIATSWTHTTTTTPKQKLSPHPNMPICHKPALHTLVLTYNTHNTHIVVALHPAPVKNARFWSRLCRDYLMSLARQPASPPAPWCKKEKDNEEEDTERERENAACGVGLCCAACRCSVLCFGVGPDQSRELALPACLPTERNGDGRKGKWRSREGEGGGPLPERLGVGVALPCLALASSFFLLLASQYTTTDCSPSPSWYVSG